MDDLKKIIKADLTAFFIMLVGIGAGTMLVGIILVAFFGPPSKAIQSPEPAPSPAPTIEKWVPGNMTFFVDPETECHYLFVNGDITPRFNRQGLPMCPETTPKE